MNKNDYLEAASVKEFIKWIEPRLDRPGSLRHSMHLKKQRMSWECDSLYSAYEHYCWPFSCSDPSTGEMVTKDDFDSSYHYLSNIAKGLRESLKGDPIACMECCIQILEWGGVSSRNDTKIKSKGTKICEYLLDVQNRLQSDLPLSEYYDGQILMNSGFTKVYAQYIDDFIMYDGRVGAALGFLVRMFCEEDAYDGVPDELAFAWGRGKESTYTRGNTNRRNPSNGKYNFPELLYNPKRHLENNIRANWLLKAIIDNTQSKFNALGQERQLIALQSALFMIGYDVTGNKTDKSKVIKFQQRNERNELREFLTVNPPPWILTFMPPSVMDAALKNEDLANLCTMKATSYYDDGETVFFMTDDDAMGMGFDKSKLNFEKKMSDEGCKAVAFFYAAAAEPDVSKDGMDWPCWVLTISTVKKCHS